MTSLGQKESSRRGGRLVRPGSSGTQEHVYCAHPGRGVRGYIYGFTVIMTIPCDSTGAENFPVDFPKSLCAHNSRTAALKWAG